MWLFPIFSIHVLMEAFNIENRKHQTNLFRSTLECDNFEIQLFYANQIMGVHVRHFLSCFLLLFSFSLSVTFSLDAHSHLVRPSVCMHFRKVTDKHFDHYGLHLFARLDLFASFLSSFCSSFLDASSHLYMRVCLSIYPSVRQYLSETAKNDHFSLRDARACQMRPRISTFVCPSVSIFENCELTPDQRYDRLTAN